MGQIIAGWDLDEFADLDYSSPPADDVWGDTFDDLGAKPKPVPHVATPEVDPLADKYAAAYQEIARRSKAATAPDGTQLDPPPDATELETLTARRARELATGIPHDDNVEQLRIAYENEVSPELKKKRLVDYQVAQRYIGERRKGLEEDRKEIKDRGITIDRKIQEEYSKVEAGLGPDMMLANAPIMRGAMTGVSNLASGIAETALRMLPGAGAPSRMADTLGRSRNAEGQRQALLDEQQGAALALPNQIIQMVGEYLPLSAVGVPAYLQVGAQGANDAYTKSKSDVYALTSGIFQGAMTYAGGKLAGGTFIDMLSGKVAGKALGPMLKGFGIESAEELGQLYGQALIDKGFGVGDGSMPTVKEAIWTLATILGGRGFGSVMSIGIEDDGVKPQPTPEEKALKALRDFAAQARPSRAAAEKAGVNQVATTAKDRAALANDMRNQAVTAPSVPPPAQESQQVAPPVDQTAQTPQPAVAPDSPPTSAILDDLASRHPEVAQALAGPTGTPEFASIREHTDVVLDRFTKSGASTGVPELDAVMPTIIALHDIGKPAAIAKGNKNLQHAETLPILERVMRAEGATDQQVEFAKTLVGQDIIGQLVKGQIDVAQAEVEMFARASEAGISPQQFHTIAAAMYNADAGSYSRLSHLFDDKGRLTDIDSRVLEEVVHGKVSSIPWSEDYRSGGQRSADAGSDGGNVYTHSSAYDFTRFDSSKDAGNNLAGPGAYLLPDGQQHIADVYKRRATAKMLSVFGPRDRSLIVKAINAKNTKQFNAWIAFLQKRQAEAVDQKRRDTYGRAADVMAVIRDNPGGKTLEFSFDPKNTLDLGTRKFGGRHLPKKVRSALVAAAKAVNPNFEPTTSPKAWDLYHQMQREFGYANVNKIVQAAGFDSIGFVHEGNRALGGPRYPVMVALDHGAPTRVQPGQKRAKPPAQKAAAKQQSQQPQQQVPPPPPATPPPVAPPVAPPVQPPPAPPGPPPTTDNLNQTQQNASGIPMDRDTRAAFTRNFISGGNQDQITRDLVYRRDSIIRKHTAKIFQGTRDLRRAVKAARHAAGKRIWNKNTPANLTDEALNDALADPTLIPSLPLKVGVEIQKIRDHIDSLTDQIQMLGGITPDMFLVLEGNKGKYITRTFKKFEDVIGWRKFALNDPTIMADFAAEVRQTSKNATDQEIRSLAEELLRRDTLRPTGLTSTSSTQAYVNILERRKDLSPAVRQLYGENKNIFDNYAATVGQMASTIAHRGFIENLKRDGLAAGTFSEVGQARNKPDHVQQVSWDKIPQLAPLKGVLMTPEMAVALNDLYGMPGTTGFLSILASGSSAVKASKTIGAFPRAFIRNFLGNIPISIANGNWNVISGVKAIGETGLEYFDKQDDATKKKWERLVELGVVESFTVDELRDAAKASNAALKSWAGMIPGSRAAKALVKGSARTYQAMDTVSKIHNYQSELKTLQKAYPGKPLFELEEEAAKITRALNPTYDEASKAARYWSRYVPLGSFAMFSAEIYRTTGNRMMRAAYEVKTGVKEGNATLFQQGMKRVAGQLAMTLLTGAAADLLQEWWGTKLSPEQEKAFRDNLPPWQKHSNIIVTQVDEEGNPISYADLGYNDPFGVFPKMINALAAGESDEAALQLVEPFVTEDILAGALLSLRRGRDEQDRPIYTEGVSKERQWMERIAFLAKKAEPGTVTSLRRFKDAVQGKTTKSGAPLSVMNEVISNLGGMRIDRFDRDTAGFYRNREYEQKIKDSQTAISKAFSGKGTFDPDEARAIWHDAHAVREQSMKEWKAYMEGLRLLGEKEPLRKVVLDTKANSAIAQQAYTGNISPYEFGEDSLAAIKQLPQGEQRLALIRELYAEAAAGKDEPALPASPFRQ